MKRTKQLLIAALISCGIFGASSAQALILPDPTGLAVRYDDFYSFSAHLLTELGYPGFDIATGTGGLDVIIYTGAGGANNDAVGAGGAFTFENPLDAPSGGPNDTFSGTWGTLQPVKVDNVVDYLHATFGSDINIPVFTFDLNDKAGLGVLGNVTIVNPTNNSTVASWAFDTIQNSTFDDTAWVTAPASITVGNITVDNNKGSGKMDFLVYAPTMNLMDYYGEGYNFYGDFRMKDLDGGFEELFLTGKFAPNNVVPEPGTMMLLGMGMLGLAVYGKRRMNSK